jgi:hypothetical protein
VEQIENSDERTQFQHPELPKCRPTSTFEAKAEEPERQATHNNLHFNRTVLVDNFQGLLVHTLKAHWFHKFGFPGTILFKQGKVQISKLEQKINKMAPLMLTITCKIRTTTLNTETEQQWKQNQHQLPQEKFINAMNLFHNI